ncbi:Cmp24/gp25L/p24 family protein [Reticulomyxa filosa]|uniref:Cmp24/gp25L/p24 family protein n=1 Tax=Reticulomyxa filosa TaxID=46433 RepID=X6P7V2_RETFI|nr:Cmp24/gp25L/p24 family protein [Reticulomyxa filosa]|eukprot:ETO34266.1 Cmp24/gp25L/p24 family protein [Reticulomyxa filosa]
MLLRSFTGLIIRLAFCTLFITTVWGIGFYLNPRELKCFTEQSNKQELIVGEFNIYPPSNVDSKEGGVKVRIGDPLAVDVYEKVVDNGKFAFTSPADGEYLICFANQESIEKTVKFDVRTGVQAKDYSTVAKKDHLKPIEAEVKRLQDIAKETLHRYKSIQNTENNIYSDTGTQFISLCFKYISSRLFSKRRKSFESKLLLFNPKIDYFFLNMRDVTSPPLFLYRQHFSIKKLIQIKTIFKLSLFQRKEKFICLVVELDESNII